MGPSVGLIIQPNNDGTYSRIGQVQVPRKNGIWEIHGAEWKVVTIV
jgi:hypothetical protein